MTTENSSGLIGSLAPSLLELSRYFLQWWHDGLNDLIPERTRRWLLGKEQRFLILEEHQGEVTLRLKSDNSDEVDSHCIKAADFSAPAISTFLQSKGYKTSEVMIGIRLPVERFFIRHFHLPVEAKPLLKGIVEQNLLQRTPFSIEDVFHSHSVAENAGSNQIAVIQQIIKREYVENALSALKLTERDAIFVEYCSQNIKTPSRIPLREEIAATLPWPRRIALLLTALALLLTVSAVGLKYWNQQHTLDALSVEIGRTRVSAQQTRSAIERLERRHTSIIELRSRKTDNPGLLVIWQELTRVLPQHSWITELRMNDAPSKGGSQLILTGHSGAASSLIGLFGQSPYFRETQFTSAIAPDPIEERERFSLQTRLATQVAAK